MTLPDSNMACLPKADYMHEDPGGAGVHLGPTGSGIGPRYRYRGDRLLLSLPVYLVPLGVWGGADGGIVLVARGPGNTAGSQHVRLYRRDYSNLGVPAYIPVIAGALVARSKITDAFLIIDPGAEPDAASASRAKETVRPPLRHAVPAALWLDTYGRDAVWGLHADPLRMGFTRLERGSRPVETRTRSLILNGRRCYPRKLRSCLGRVSHTRLRNSGMATLPKPLSNAWSAIDCALNQNG
jgi:hypothetical protein